MAIVAIISRIAAVAARKRSIVEREKVWMKADGLWGRTRTAGTVPYNA